MKIRLLKLYFGLLALTIGWNIVPVIRGNYVAHDAGGTAALIMVMAVVWLWAEKDETP